MKLREHRSLLDESLSTVIEISATMDSLKTAISNVIGKYVNVHEGMIHVAPYCFDKRIGWDTHIVTVDGYGVFGFTDAPVLNS